MRSRKIFVQWLFKIVALVAFAGVASAQLYVADPGHKRVSAYSPNGTPINISFIAGFDPASEGPTDVEVAGTNIYVLSTLYTNGDGFGTISKYNLDGSVVNATLITNISGYPQNFTVSGTNIFVSSGNSGVIGKYSTSGATINSNLITGLTGGPEKIAIVGTNLFVAIFGDHKIGKYTTDGAAINPSFITGLGQCNGLAISGTNLFTVETSTGRIGKYSTEGATINSLFINGLISPRNMAILGTNLFVTDDFYNRVGVYTLSGAPINSTLITNLLYAFGIAAAPTFQSITPGNSSVALTWNTVEGHTYQLQYTTNLTQPRWANFLSPTTAVSVAASASNNITGDPQRFFRVLTLP
jgi:hypothetical protein